MGELVSIDGRIVAPADAQVSVFDHGFLYGDGVFEGIRIVKGGILLLDEHLRRLFDSADQIRLRVPHDYAALEKIVLDAVAHSGLADGYIRLVVSRGIGDLGLNPTRCKTAKTFVIVSKIALYPEELYEKGLRVCVTKTRKPAAIQLPGAAKSCNYLNNIQAVWDYLDHDCHEGLMLTPDGFVSEATADNVFGIRGNTLFTPSLSTNCLPGITRAQILRIAHAAGFDVEAGLYRPVDFQTADEVFLTGTGAGIIAVAQLDGRTIGAGGMGAKTRSLRQHYEKQIPAMSTPFASMVTAAVANGATV